MSDEPAPDDVRDLIQRHIDSVAQLEDFLLLRDHPADLTSVPIVPRTAEAFCEPVGCENFA